MPQIDTPFVQLVWQQFWQCSLLVLAVYLICRLIRFRRSHLTFILWLIVLLKFMTPPVWSSSSGLFCWVQESLTATAPENPKQPEQHSLTLTESIRLLIGDDLSQLPDVDPNASRMKVTVHDGVASEQRDRASETVAVLPESVVNESGQPAFEWTLIDVAILSWAFVAALIMAVMGIRYARCWMILRRAGEQHRPDLDQLLARLCAELHLKRRVRLMITNSRMGPAVIGLFRPTIILPTAITDARSLQELEPILAHELIHIRRGDLWIGLLQLLASVVWWFHPLVWFTGRRLKLEIEQCCDEEVLAGLKCDPRLYARCLLEVLELKQTLNTVPVVPGVRPVEITSKRLERIMKLGQGCQKRTPWWCWMIFITLAAVMLPGAAFVVTAADPPERVLAIDQTLVTDKTESTVLSQQTETGLIQSLPFYEELKDVADLNKRFRDMYSTDLSYLAPEIDMRDWVSRTTCIRAYPIKELLERARSTVGPIQAEQYLEKKINARIRELRQMRVINQKRNFRNGGVFFFETVQVPLKDERKQYRFVIYYGSCIRNDLLIVWAKDEQYHREVEEVLAELSKDEFTLLELNAKFISVPRSLLEQLSSQRKSIKVFQLKQVPVVTEGENSGKLVSVGAETISRSTLICEVLDEKRINEVQQLILSSASCQVLSAPRVKFLDGQTVQFETKNRSVFEIQLTGAGQQISVTNTDAGFATHVKYSASKGINQRGMLDYQIAYSEIDGLTKQKFPDRKTGQEIEVEVPSITKRHFKDANLMKPGQVLLVGGLELQQETDEPKVLLVMFQLDQVKPAEESHVLQGVGVNSDAGVTGLIQLDESNFKNTLRTEIYPVADLVVPIPRKLVVPGEKPGPVEEPVPQPRFDPLIELIKQNVTPEAWGDEKKADSTIMPYPKMLALVVRQTREGHEKLAELLLKLRAVQDRQICLHLQLLTADDLDAWLETWNKSASPVAHDLETLLKTKQLDEGMLLSSKQMEVLIQMSERGKRVNLQELVKVTTFNGQPAVLNLFGSPLPDEKSKALIQLRPELLKDQRLRLSFVINAKNALDAISYLKSATIPQGQSMLVDITDQLSREDSSFLFDQFVRQAEMSYQKQTKRCFLLVTPAVLNVSEAVEQRATPPSR